MKALLGKSTAVTVLLMLIVQLCTPTASAAINPDIIISDLKIESSDVLGNLTNNGDDRLMLGRNVAKISFSFDASQTDVIAGDQIVVVPGPEFSIGVDQSYDLTLPYQGAQVKVATCELKRTTGLVCTFNNRISTLKAAGAQDFTGKISFVAGLAQTTAKSSVDFQVNGKTVSVALPGDQPIGQVAGTYRRSGFSKDTSNLLNRNSDMGWGVSFNTANLQQQLAATGDSRVFDGQTHHTLTFIDSVGPGQEFSPDLNRWILKFKGNSELYGAFGTVPTDAGCVNVTLANGAGASLVTTDNFYQQCMRALADNNIDFDYSNEFTMKVTFLDDNGNVGTYKDRRAKIEITGPFEADANYAFNPAVSVAGWQEASAAEREALKIKLGSSFENTIVSEDTGQAVTATGKAFQTLTGTITMQDRFGTFSLTKFVQGLSSNAIPAGTTFTVTAKWTLPQGTTVKDYSNWQPSSSEGIEFNYDTTDPAEAHSGTAIFSLTPGNKVTFPDPFFPVGTRIELSEDTTSMPTISGVEWADATFRRGGNTVSPAFTIQNKQNLDFEVVNTAQKKLGTLKVAKKIEGIAEATEAFDLALNSEFTFEYRCGTDAAFTTINTKVPGNGQAVTVATDLPDGTTCQVREKEVGPTVGGFKQTGTIPATVMIQGDTEVTATVTNIYQEETGGISFIKQIKTDDQSSEAAALGDLHTYKFTYTCTKEGRTVKEATDVAATVGEPVTITGIPLGAECEVEENYDAAQLAGFDLIRPSKKTIIASADPAAHSEVFENEYTLKTGGFSIKKLFDDPTLSDSLGDVTFDVVCTSPLGTKKQEFQVTVPASGAVTEVPGVQIGSECTVTEDAASAEIKNYELVAVDPQTVVAVENPKDKVVEFTNAYTKKTGAITVTKQVKLANGQEEFQAEFDAIFDKNQKFDFHYDCGTAGQGDFQLADGESFELAGITIGAECSITEENASGIAGFSLKTVAAQTATVPGVDDPAQQLQFVNEYTRETGGLKVQKVVTGDRPQNLDPSHLFGVTLTCDRASTDGQLQANTPKTLELPASGEFVETGLQLPSGTQCQLSNETNLTTDEISREGYVANEPEYGSVTISADTEAAIAVTNSYTKQVGTFSIRKNVTGDDAETLEKKNFSFRYTCGELGNQITGTIGVAGDGSQSEPSQEIPVGWHCALEETNGTEAGYDLNTTGLTELTIAEGAQNSVTVTNEYTRHLGSFAVTKKTNDGLMSGQLFRMVYTCSDDPGVAKELMVPANGTPVVVDKLPTGTTCTVEEDLDAADQPGYTRATSYDNNTVTITQDEVAQVIVRNDYTPTSGSLQISKSVVGNAAAVAPQVFNFTYTCTPEAADAEVVTDTVAVSAGQIVTIEDLPTGSCEVTENLDATPANVTVESALNDATGTSVTVEVTEDATTVVEATNTYTIAFGSVSVAKTINLDELQDRSFSLDYQCTSFLGGALRGSITVPATGEPVRLPGELPIGSSCQISEELAKNAISGYHLAEVEPQTVVIGAGDNQITIANTATRDVGAVTLTKQVVGNDEFATKKFRFTYTCTDTGDRVESIEVTGDGTPVTVRDDVPTGTSCTVTEDEEAAAADHYFLNMEKPKAVTVPADGGSTNITFTNTYTKKPYWIIGLLLIPAIVGGAEALAGVTTPPGVSDPGTPAQPATPDPGQKGIAKDNPAPAKTDNGTGILARTGASVLGIAVIALLLGILGVFLIRRGKNKKS